MTTLKRISVEDVCLGMFIQGFVGSWLDHPFWRNRFVLESEDDLARIRASAVREVWIDTSQGVDVPVLAIAEPAHAEPLPVAVAPSEAEIAAMQVFDRSVHRQIQPCSQEAEMERAAQLINGARGAVVSMFQDMRMGRAINREMAQAVAEEIADSVCRHSTTLLSLARIKTADDYTYMHSVAVCALMVALARQMGLSDTEARAAGTAGLLHDVGKVDIPSDILNKPGKLSDEEFAIVRQHPRQGWQRLKDAGVDEAVTLDVCLHHHERFVGKGYPDSLDGEGISLMARMGAVCDVYDAITSNRPYKAGWDPAESLKRMASWKGDFDPRVFQAFVRSLGIYPSGSLVQLSNGRLAVVVEQSPDSLLTPVVKTVYSTRSNERVLPERIDLSQVGSRIKILQREDPAQWNIPDLDEIWSGIPGLGRG